MSIVKSNYIVPVALFAGFFALYYLTSAGNTPYDYFTRLGSAFLQGRWWLTENPAWLNELIEINGKYFVALPPMPAVVSIPFVFLFKDFAQEWLAHLLGALGVVGTYLVIKTLTDKKNALWASLLVGAGSVFWFLAANGSAWYLGQVSAFTFLTFAILARLNKKYFLAGILFGACYLSRVHIALAIPFFLIEPLLKKDLKKIFHFTLSMTPFLIFNFAYNFVRFGSFWDIGYSLIPGVLDEPWYEKGLVHPSYISRHLDVAFTALPKLLNGPPFVQPSWGGLAIWITTPAFIFSLFAPLKERLVKLAWLAIFLVSLPIIMHGTTGFAQFGYRFAVDIYPFLIILTSLGVQRIGIKKLPWLLLTVGILVNFWGVVWINKFGWVGY